MIKYTIDNFQKIFDLYKFTSGHSELYVNKRFCRFRIWNQGLALSTTKGCFHYWNKMIHLTY